jgi:hypothetical protein
MKNTSNNGLARKLKMIIAIYELGRARPAAVTTMSFKFIMTMSLTGQNEE